MGGGFGGIRAALDLARSRVSGLRVILVSARPNFEYSAGLYRVAAGGSPKEVSIPLETILRATGVDIRIDTVTAVDPAAKRVTCTSGQKLGYDMLILATGAEPAFFGIPGVEQHALTMKSVADAESIRTRVHDASASGTPAHIAIIGGGPTGVELAGELLVYGQCVAKQHGRDPSAVTVDLIEALPRILSVMPEAVSARVQKHLQSMGVNVILGQSIQRVESDRVVLPDEERRAAVLLWTAGVQAHHLPASISGISVDKKGRVIVDEFLRATGVSDIFAIGDVAATTYSGMAQTAIHDARFAARHIDRILRGLPLVPYRPKKPAYAVPAGPGWAAVLYMGGQFYGRLGWLLRHAADIRAFLTMLSPLQVARLLRAGARERERCPVCAGTVTPPRGA